MKSCATFLLLAALMGLLPMQSTAQPTDSVECPPACGVRLWNPPDPSRAPDVRPETLVVSPGELVSFIADGHFRVRFTSETPFVDRNGNPVRQFTTQSMQNRDLRVRQDGAACTTAPGCKYDIVDLRDPGRPVRDPHIIIRR